MLLGHFVVKKITKNHQMVPPGERTPRATRQVKKNEKKGHNERMPALTAEVLSYNSAFRAKTNRHDDRGTPFAMGANGGMIIHNMIH